MLTKFVFIHVIQNHQHCIGPTRLPIPRRRYYSNLEEEEEEEGGMPINKTMSAMSNTDADQEWGKKRA